MLDSDTIPWHTAVASCYKMWNSNDFYSNLVGKIIKITLPKSLRK